MVQWQTDVPVPVCPSGELGGKIAKFQTHLLLQCTTLQIHIPSETGQDRNSF